MSDNNPDRRLPVYGFNSATNEHFAFIHHFSTTHKTPWGPHINPAHDLVERHELYELEPDEKKVTINPETRVPNASVFTFAKEDHTLGNLLRARLLQSPNVLFSAYKVPHPLVPNFELRVQTDGTIAPKDALIQACKDIITDLQTLGQEFTKEWELKKISQMSDGMNGDRMQI